MTQHFPLAHRRRALIVDDELHRQSALSVTVARLPPVSVMVRFCAVSMTVARHLSGTAIIRRNGPENAEYVLSPDDYGRID